MNIGLLIAANLAVISIYFESVVWFTLVNFPMHAGPGLLSIQSTTMRQYSEKMDTRFLSLPGNLIFRLQKYVGD